MRRLVLIGALLIAACGAPQAGKPSTVAGDVDRIIVEKAERRMTLYAGDRAVRVYRISLGRGGLSPKTQEGDKRTPEGDYLITGRNARSAYHLSLRIGYPTAAQIEAARARGVRPGSDIMIHGLPNGRGQFAALYTGRDWTDGCIAVTDSEIEEIWRLTRDGAQIRILP